MKPDQDRELDRMIRDALSAEERELYDRLGSPSLPEMMTDLYRGRLRWLALMVTVVICVFTFLGVYAGYRFYHAQETRELMHWGAVFFFCALAVIGNKLWHWMELQRHALTREIKRLELQVAHLAQELDRSER